MAGATARISPAARHALREIASRTGEPMQAIFDQAIEAYRRQRLLDEANAAYATLRKVPAAWRAELEERAARDATLADGADPA